MILSDDKIEIKQEYGVYRKAPFNKLGIIAKEDSGRFRFFPSGVALNGHEMKIIESELKAANEEF